MSRHDQNGESKYNKELLKKFTKYFILIVVFMALGWWATSYTKFLETTSLSLERVRYLLVVKSSSLKRYDIVSIEGHTPHYVGKHSFTKRIIGLPGDQIIRNKTTLAVKHQSGSFSLTLPLLKKTKEGDPLTPLSLSTIPEGHFFVIGDHPRSFDSRYEEFGLIPLEKVWGKVVLTWP